MSPFATSTVGHTESYACGVQIRPHSEARETEAGKAVWQQLLDANIRAKNPHALAWGVCQRYILYFLEILFEICCR